MERRHHSLEATAAAGLGRRRAGAVGAICCAVVAVTAAADTAPPCDIPNISVDVEKPVLAHRICSAADEAVEALAGCSIGLTDPVNITLRADLINECLGLFHCDTREIELLNPEVMAKRQRENSVFYAVSPEAFFDSVVLHELVHATYEQSPCDTEACITSSEYLAYALQIELLPAAERARVDMAGVVDRQIDFNEINLTYLMLAPEKFAVKAWRHLKQQDDTCAFANAVLGKKVLFEPEMP